VCDFIGAFQDQKQMYIVMEHAGGGDLLEQLLKEGRAMTEKRTVIEVVLPCLAALVHMHDLGIVHRDIKVRQRTAWHSSRQAHPAAAVQPVA
jgi:serine/threonine protein kinase